MGDASSFYARWGFPKPSKFTMTVFWLWRRFGGQMQSALFCRSPFSKHLNVYHRLIGISVYQLGFNKWYYHDSKCSHFYSLSDLMQVILVSNLYFTIYFLFQHAKFGSGTSFQNLVFLKIQSEWTDFLSQKKCVSGWSPNLLVTISKKCT